VTVNTPARDELLPPGGYLGLMVASGQTIRIVDVEGGQVADFFSFSADRPSERLSMYFSRALQLTWKLTAGHQLVSAAGNAMWHIDTDTLGDNYCGGGYCNPRVNALRYGRPDVPTCEGNAAQALLPWGLDASSIDADTVFNVFMNVAYDPDGRWEIRDPQGRAGDHIDLRATMDQIVAVSNCPQLLNRCNGGRLKPLRVQLFDRSST
jgi:uncharacterized protein YcgI (DUF1989 family)